MSFGVERVQISKKKHAPKALALGIGFSGALGPTAAQDLAAYTVFSGKVKKVHKVSQVLYNKLVPLSQAIYFPASNTVALPPVEHGNADLGRFHHVDEVHRERPGRLGEPALVQLQELVHRPNQAAIRHDASQVIRR
jgi:hypothetical protein